MGQSQNVTSNAKLDFASTKADAFLVAHAKQHHFHIVTAEKFSPDVKKRILIPNAAKAFGIRTFTLCEFLQRHAGHNFSVK